MTVPSRTTVSRRCSNARRSKARRFYPTPCLKHQSSQTPDLPDPLAHTSLYVQADVLHPSMERAITLRPKHQWADGESPECPSIPKILQGSEAGFDHRFDHDAISFATAGEIALYETSAAYHRQTRASGRPEERRDRPEPDGPSNVKPYPEERSEYPTKLQDQACSDNGAAPRAGGGVRC